MRTFLSLLLIGLSINLAAQIIHLSEDFNGGSLPNGWTNNVIVGSVGWSFGVDGSVDETGNNNLDGTNMAYFDDDAQGNGSSNTVELISPTFDNTAFTITRIEFDYNFRQLTSLNDSFYVEVFDGANWQTVFSRDYDDCGRWTTCTNNYPHANIDISAHANANCQIRFTYFDNNDWGWHIGIDNIVVSSPFDNDLQVSKIIAPTSGCGLTANDSITVQIKNLGTLTQSNFDIAYSIDGNPSVVETITQTIAPFDSLVFTFNTTANFSTLKDHRVKAYTILTNDSATLNDTTTTSITNEAIYSLTYYEDFEDSTHHWKVSGSNPSWERGMPNNSLIDTTLNGQNAFVTNLNGNYNNDELSYLTSPCFNFSALTTDPILNFDLIYFTEDPIDPYDYAWIEYSIDNGSTWSKISRGNYNKNWYNNSNSNAWQGSSNQWLKVENQLAGLAGESQAKLRFVFKSDLSVTEEGIGIDNIVIREQATEDITTSAIITPDSSNICGFKSQEYITIEIINMGSNSISSFDASYSVDNGNVVTEMGVTPSSPIPSYGIYLHTFSQPIQLTNNTKHVIKSWTEINNDSLNFNDSAFTILNSKINNSIIATPYLENFDGVGFKPGTNFTATDDSLRSDWTREPSDANSYSWRVLDGQTGSANTGPNQDYSGSGNFLYTEASLGGAGDTAYLISPCISLDTSLLSSPYLSFQYHRYGNLMGDLYVEVYDGSLWHGIDTLTQKPQTSSSAPYSFAQIGLSAYKNMIIKIRFSALSQGCCAGDIAIDNFNITDSLTTANYNNLDSQTIITLYPNPSKGEYFIASKKNLSGMEYQILDLHGRAVKTGLFKPQQKSFDLSAYTEGIYFLVIPEIKVKEKLVKY